MQWDTGGRPVVVATDMDRTFTRLDLTLDPRAIARAIALRRAGVKVLLVTGRPLAELPVNALRPAFDGMALEGGAVWGTPGRWSIAPVGPAMWRLADRLEAAGHEVRRHWAALSVPAAAEGEMDPSLSWRRNKDRIDVTPPGVDKGSGLRELLAGMGLASPPFVLGMGDASNDLPLARASDAFVAVANAEPELKAAATVVAPAEASDGFLWAVSGLG